MTSQWGGDNFRTTVDWAMVESVSMLLKDTCDTLQLDRNSEWICEVIKENAETLPNSIHEGQQSEYVAEYILGISAARNSLVIVSYCFNFLKTQGLMDEDVADGVETKLQELEQALDGLTESLRRDLPNQWRYSNN